MPRHRFHLAGLRIDPEGVRAAFSLEVTPVQTQVP
jgi:hypothetical protein